VFIATHGSSTDTLLYVRSCSCTATEVACNDDADGASTSALRLPNLAPGTYTVFVDTKSASAATVSLDLSVTEPGSESERCGNPSVIAPGSTELSGETCGFQDDYQFRATDACVGESGFANDRVFYFYPPEAGTVTFDGCRSGHDYDSAVAIRSVCTGQSQQVACVDDADCGGGRWTCGGGTRSSVSEALPAGLYYVIVDGYGTTGCPCGSYRFSVSGI
jgi:hypothetical protein